MSRETPDSDNDATCAELRNDPKFMSQMEQNSGVGGGGGGGSRPVSVVSDAVATTERRWVDIVSGECATREGIGAFLNTFLK